MTSDIRAGQKFFNSMVLSSIDPGGRKSFSPCGPVLFIHVRPHSMAETRFFLCCWKTI